MTNKKTNFIYGLDGEKYSKEEQAFLIYCFCMCWVNYQKNKTPKNSK